MYNVQLKKVKLKKDASLYLTPCHLHIYLFANLFIMLFLVARSFC